MSDAALDAALAAAARAEHDAEAMLVTAIRNGGAR